MTVVAGAVEVDHRSQLAGALIAGVAVAAIGVLLLTAIVTSVLADRARTRADDAEERLELQRELRRRDAERAHLQEVRASRSRVIQAAGAERRRVVRDLHDGAQQSLVHTVVTLRLAESEVEPGHPVAGLVGEALGHAERATTELRELVHGILPAALTRSGLRTALSSLASRMPLPVTVTAREGALRLLLEISDDGVGGATADGHGLTGLADRLAAHDGTLAIASPPGRGTRVIATLPVS